MRPAKSLNGAAHAEEMLGEVRALATTVGLPGAPALVESATTSLPTIQTETQWRRFLCQEFTTVLLSQEGPLIVQAHRLTCLGHVRELVALDQTWGHARKLLPAYLPAMNAASAHVGQAQLRRLLPLRDQRIVPRYLAAIAAGEAHGWHPLVYGLLLGVFALPLRPGVLHYGRQTARGVLAGSPLAHALDESAQNRLLDEAEQAVLTLLPQLLPFVPPEIV